MNHGTTTAYVNEGCRCELCRERWKLCMRAYRERARARARGELPARPPPRRVLRVDARVHELLELRRRGVKLKPGDELKAELAELRRMRRAS